MTYGTRLLSPNAHRCLLNARRTAGQLWRELLAAWQHQRRDFWIWQKQRRQGK